jgi:hypothetical protein
MCRQNSHRQAGEEGCELLSQSRVPLLNKLKSEKMLTLNKHPARRMDRVLISTHSGQDVVPKKIMAPLPPGSMQKTGTGNGP